MGLLDALSTYFKGSNNVNPIVADDDYSIESVGNIVVPEKITDANAFILANSVAEIFFPIDFIADRASKVRFLIVDKNGNELKSSDYTRLLTDINPFYTFSELFYQAVFSYLGSGNAILYTGIPIEGAKLDFTNVTRLDVLKPNHVDIRELSRVDMLSMVSESSIMQSAYYCESAKEQLMPDRITIARYDSINSNSSILLSRSPLFKAEKSINSLLAVYSARYNVYANNGAAGYLTKKGAGKGLDSVASGDREDILKDINSRNGITGNKNLWGISSVPLEFVKTLAEIKDLMPLDETLENSVKIAGVFQVPSVLVPRKDQATFSNQKEAETSVWENTIKSVVDLMCEKFTKALHLRGAKIIPDYSSVSVLSQNKKGTEEVISMKLDNLRKMRELDPTIKIDDELKKILNEYGQG